MKPAESSESSHLAARKKQSRGVEGGMQTCFASDMPFETAGLFLISVSESQHFFMSRVPCSVDSSAALLCVDSSRQR